MPELATMDLDAEFALLVGASISVLFSILSFIFAHPSSRRSSRAGSAFKVAEFRQAWINDVRETLSSLWALAHSKKGQFDEAEFFRFATRLELLMNPKNADYGALSETVYEIRYLSIEDENARLAHFSKFVEISQRVLKREWDRTKSDLRALRV